jgi:hypothetical protein
MTALLVPVLLAAGGAAGEGGFNDLWYRETMLGDVDGALRGYVRLYLDLDADPDKPTPLPARLRAAFRAGACAEKLGDRDRALQAYGWLRANGPPSDAWALKAGVRLRALGAESPAPPASAAASEPPRAELAARRAAALEFLRGALAEKRRLHERTWRILQRLRSLGIECRWPAAESDEGARAGLAGRIAELFGRLQLANEDFLLLRRRLAQVFHRQALSALALLELGRARDLLQLQLELVPVEDAQRSETLRASELLQSCRQILQMAQGLRLAAERWLREVPADQEALASSQAARLLRSARQLEALGQRDEARQLYDEIGAHAAWALPGLREDGRFHAAFVQAARECSLINGGPATGGGAAARSAPEDEMAWLIETLLSPWSLPEGGASAPWWSGEPWPAAELIDSSRTLPRLRTEIERVLDRADAPPSPRARPPEAGLTNIEDALLVLEWFPQLDESGQLARRLQRHRR